MFCEFRAGCLFCQTSFLVSVPLPDSASCLPMLVFSSATAQNAVRREAG